MGSHDGEHQTTARKVQVRKPVPIQATRMGTDAAFMNKGDGSGQVCVYVCAYMYVCIVFVSVCVCQDGH